MDETPKPVVERLNAEFARAAFAPEVQKRFSELGATPVSPSPAQITAQISKEREQWATIIKRAGIRPN